MDRESVPKSPICILEILSPDVRGCSLIPAIGPRIVLNLAVMKAHGTQMGTNNLR